MPFVDLGKVTVTGTYLMLDETPASGSVAFEISDATVQALQDATANQIVVPKRIVVSLDVAGHFSVSLPATDDPDVSPTGFAYRVTENINSASGNRPRAYDIVVPESGGTIDLADVAPVVTLPGISTYVLLPTFNALEQRVTDLEAGGAGALDPDLTAFANLTPADNDVVQRKAGAWTNRTARQLLADQAVVQGDVAGLTAALAAKAPLANAALTGAPTTPDPTVPTGIANKQWVEAIASSSKSKADVQYAAFVPLPANTYANGTLGVGATLTGTANGALVIDGVTLAAGQVNQEVLVGGEAALANNGWYKVTRVGTGGTTYQLTRRVADDQAAEIGPGFMTSVKGPAGFTPGTANDNKVFLSSAPSPFVVGTDALTFTPMGGTYAAGNGVLLSGNQFTIDPAVTADLASAQTFTNKTLTAPVLQNPSADTMTITGLPGSGLAQTRTVGRGTFLTAFTGAYVVGDKVPILGGSPFELICTTAGTVGVGAGPTFEVLGQDIILAGAAAATADQIAAITDIAVDTSLVANTAGGVMTIGSATPTISVQRTTDDRVVAAANPNWATQNATPTGDNVLKLPVAANSLYRFWLYIIYNMAANAGGRFAFASPTRTPPVTLPAGSTIFWTPGALAVGATTPAGNVTKQSGGVAALQVAGVGGPAVATIEGTLRTGATAGFLEFLAAHWTAQASDGFILTGSSFVLTKLA